MLDLLGHNLLEVKRVYGDVVILRSVLIVVTNVDMHFTVKTEVGLIIQVANSVCVYKIYIKVDQSYLLQVVSEVESWDEPVYW
ncbi:hypothetical protein DGG96_19795 [Legionella qingyii]|uniref:Uncharacterized protein n=1 Tax=Legionella qingyii TaxID=2184757 RepID=A0A317TYI2_9GAMM|nr:hypothetical protein DGG96_19795 [Legionella qingyii]